MHKRIIDVQHKPLSSVQGWLNLEGQVEVEMTSEDPEYPIESALQNCSGSGWRASEPGTQMLRLVFFEPRKIFTVRLVFVESEVERTQEYALRWSTGTGQPYKEIVRQQWNFCPEGANTEIETHDVDLSGVKVMELIITPDINNSNAIATLQQLQIA